MYTVQVINGERLFVLQRNVATLEVARRTERAIKMRPTVPLTGVIGIFQTPTTKLPLRSLTVAVMKRTRCNTVYNYLATPYPKPVPKLQPLIHYEVGVLRLFPS